MKRRIIVLVILLGILALAAVAIQFGPNIVTAVQQHGSQQSAASATPTQQGKTIVIKNGKVTGQAGDCSGFTFTLGQYHVTATKGVKVHGGQCGDVIDGAVVTVSGLQNGMTVTAQEITIVSKAQLTLLQQAQTVANLSWQKANPFVVYAQTDPGQDTTVTPGNMPAGYFLVVRDGEYLFFGPNDQPFTLPAGKTWHLTVMLSSGVSMEESLHSGLIEGDVTQMSDSAAYAMMFGASGPDGTTNSVAYKSLTLQTNDTITILPGFVGELVVNGQHITLENPGTFTIEGLVGSQTGTLFITHVETQGNLNSVANSQVTLQPTA